MFVGSLSLDSLSVPLGAQPVSSLSHLLAAGVALLAAVPLVRLERVCPRRKLAVVIYTSCVIVTLAISGIYHHLALDAGPRQVMQRIDHCAIWFLIAGTFTAVHGIMWQGFWRRGLLTFIWSYAVVGMMLQMLWFRAFVGNAGLVLYLGLGWVGALSIYKLGREIGWSPVVPLFCAGIAYSGGAILEAVGWPVLMPPWVSAHEVFHFVVIGGVILHWRFIRRLLLHHAPPVDPVVIG
jgi:channel protein (hemolysin III family)